MDTRLKVSLVVALIALALSFLLLRPLFISVITSMVISYIFYPVYIWINKRIKHKSVSSFLVILLIIIILIVPSFFAVNALSREIFSSYLKVKQSFSGEGACNTVACAIISALPLEKLDPNLSMLISNNVGKVTAYLFTQVSNIIISLPQVLFNFFVILFLTYYLLKDSDKLLEFLRTAIPIKKVHQEELISRVTEVTNAVVFGNLVIAIIQGFLAGLGFFFFGISSPISWGILTVFTALIPFLGAFAVWFSLSIITFLNGYIANQPSTMLRAIGLAAYGLLIISTVDNVLKPKIIGAGAKIHPAIILLGVVGGVTLFGVIGIIIGPLLLALSETALTVFEKERTSS
jgi:predicted PurR-regulated permease PerM